METTPWVVEKPMNFERVQLLLKPSIEQKMMTNSGPAKNNLERVIHKKLKIDSSKRIFMTCSGTAALHCIVSAYNIAHDKPLRWATQAFTFPSSVLGPLKHSFIVDNDRHFFGPSLEELNGIVDDIDGIIVTNVFGNLVDINTYVSWSAHHKKILLFDNAATPLSFINGSNALNYGDGSIVSFHETKPLGRGEGGCIVCDKGFYSYVERAANFGFEFGALMRERHSEASNWRMSDIAAVFIHDRLELLTDVAIEEILNLCDSINEYLENSPIVSPLFHKQKGSQIFMSCICIQTSTEVDIDKFKKFTGIEAKRYYLPLRCDAPISWDWFRHSVCLPFLYNKPLEINIALIKTLEHFISVSNK